MAFEYAILQTAVFDRFYYNKSWLALATTHNISVTTIRRYYNQWAANYPESQPQVSVDIHIDIRPRGRPPSLTTDEEQIIAEAVQYYASNNTPLSRQGVLDLVQKFVGLLPSERQSQIGFFNNRPSNQWINHFCRRNNLEVLPVHIMEDKRVKAETPRNLTEHITRVCAALKRFNINNPKYIFNTDQSGASFSKMKGRSLRKGIGLAGYRLLQIALTTQGNLDRVTIMSVVSGNGEAYKPVVVFPGRLAHYRQVRGTVQSLHAVLPPCYLFERNPAGVDTDVVYQWAQAFLEETKELRAGNQMLLLLLDGYGSHIQYHTLKLFRDNNVVVIALPAHTSHITQPLDVSVFSSYKSHLQRELHIAARQKKKLNAFDVAQCIDNAYSNSHTATNIRSGFHKTGIWDMHLMKPNFAPLERYLLERNGNDVSKVTIEQLLESYERHHRTLLRDALVEDSGHVRIDTASGAHITSTAVIEALHKRILEKKDKMRKKKAKERLAAYREPKTDIHRLVDLAPMPFCRREQLCKSRAARRSRRRDLARAHGAEERAAAWESVPGPVAPDSDNETMLGC